LPFVPGLVGGHCIGVDPYYLTFRAEKAGYHPEIILAGRRINDGMGERVSRECMRALAHRGYITEGWGLMMRLLKGGEGVVLDVKSKLDRAQKPEGVELWRL
jgi:hypothetical protein